MKVMGAIILYGALIWAVTWGIVFIIALCTPSCPPAWGDDD